MHRFRAGDLQAMQELHGLYDSRLRAFVHSLCRSHDVEDVLQETWLKAWNGRERYSDKHFAGWLFAIARNCVSDTHRRSKRVHKPLVFDPVQANFTSSEDRILALRHCLGSVKQQFVEILRLKIDGLKDREISTQLGISSGTVASRASRGRDELKECIEKKLQ